MANRYGEAALVAARLDTYGKSMTPQQRWDEAVKRLYPTTPAAQKKNAPRAAFLGLCEAGFVVGVPAPPSGSTNRNKTYAVEAARLVAAGTHTTVTQLWSAVKGDDDLPHASQMDVVLALWKNGLLSPRAPELAQS